MHRLAAFLLLAAAMLAQVARSFAPRAHRPSLRSPLFSTSLDVADIYHIPEVDVHSSLGDVVDRHYLTHNVWLQHHPVATHTQENFKMASEFVRVFHEQRGLFDGPFPVILDR